MWMVLIEYRPFSGPVKRDSLGMWFHRHNASIAVVNVSDMSMNPVSPVPSPCVSLCKMDTERRYCMGCLRTLEELRNWRNADDDYKRAVWAELARRREYVVFESE